MCIPLCGGSRGISPRKSPALQVLAHGSYGHLDTQSLPNQLPNGRTGPQGKGHLELVGCLVGDQPLDLPFLFGTQGAFLAGFTATFLELNPFGALVFVGLAPLANGRGVDADDFGNAGVGATGFPEPNRLVA